MRAPCKQPSARIQGISGQVLLAHSYEKRGGDHTALHCLLEIRKQAARPRLGAQDHTIILAIHHLGTRHGRTAQEIVKGRKDTSARRSRQVHQMDRSSAHHQLNSPHGSQLHQVNHLQVRYHTTSSRTMVQTSQQQNSKTFVKNWASKSTTHHSRTRSPTVKRKRQTV